MRNNTGSTQGGGNSEVSTEMLLLTERRLYLSKFLVRGQPWQSPHMAAHAKSSPVHAKLYPPPIPLWWQQQIKVTKKHNFLSSNTGYRQKQIHITSKACPAVAPSPDRILLLRFKVYLLCLLVKWPLDNLLSCSCLFSHRANGEHYHLPQRVGTRIAWLETVSVTSENRLGRQRSWLNFS